MLKILQIVSYYYPHIGGIEQVARNIATSLSSEANIAQKIICFNEDATSGNIANLRKENTKDVVDGIEVTRCACFAKMASQSLSLSYPRKLKELLSDFKPDIVIFHYPNPYMAFFLLRILPKDTKFILFWHLDITKQKILGKLFHNQTLSLLKRADRIIATSPNYLKGSKYLPSFKNKCTVIPLCIDDKTFIVKDEDKKKARDIKEKYKNKTILLAMGRHVPYKGMEYLIEASKLLDDDYAVLIGGKGPLTDSLKQKAKEDKKVIFLGRIPNNELNAYYLACDIFCFPSITKNEAFGIALAEAMYFAKPAITFTIEGSGVNFVSLDGISGIECPNRDVEAYAKAIKKLASNKELRENYGVNARKRVVDNFMFSDFSKNINKLINEINDGGTKR